jgi:hypothetical protein
MSLEIIYRHVMVLSIVKHSVIEDLLSNCKSLLALTPCQEYTV